MKYPRSLRRTARGLTLIELPVAVALMAVVIGIALTSLQSLSHSHLRSSAVQIAGAIKGSYDRAIMNKRIERIAFDLEEDRWWVEFTEDPYALDVERQANPDEDDVEDDLYLDEETPPEVRAALEGNRAAAFSPEPSFGQKRLLPGEVHFGRAWTGMREEPFEQGIVYIHFFRGGFTQPLQLELFVGRPDERRDRKEWVTIKVRPLTGRVKTYSRQLEEPDDEGRPWEEDDR